MAHDVFVSYSNKEKAVADAVIAAIEKNGIRCWYAPRDINPGQSWSEAITDAIKGGKVFLLIFSANANQSQHVLDELLLAINCGIPVLPFRIEDLAPSGAMELHLSSRHWLDAYDPSWEVYINDLIKAVRINLGASDSDGEIFVPAEIVKPGKTTHNLRNNRILAGVLITALVLSVGWLGWRSLGTGTPAQELNQDESTQVVAEQQTTFAPQASAETTETHTPTETPFSFSASESTQGEPAAACRIVFKRIDDSMDTYAIDPDGGNEHLLSWHAPGNAYSWSPDGVWLGMESDLNRTSTDILLINMVSGEERWLTNDDFSDFAVAISPDGERVAFCSDREGEIGIYTMNPDGSDLRQHSSGHYLRRGRESGVCSLAWSPDGSQLAFLSDVEGTDTLYISDADGGAITPLVSADEIEEVDWSPDGSELLYNSLEEEWGIRAIQPDGSGRRELIGGGDYFGQAAWSPDGSAIVFSRGVHPPGGGEEDRELWVMQADGSQPVQLTFNDTNEYDPAWSPACR
jgi:Tol biopolymer transport system component